MHGIEKVHPTEILWPAQRFGQRGDGNGRCIRGQDGGLGHRPLRFGEHRLFDFGIFHDRFDHHIHIVESVVPQGRLNPVQRLAHGTGGHATFLDTLDQQPVGFFQPLLQAFAGDVFHFDRHPLECRLVGNAAAHDPGAQDRRARDTLFVLGLPALGVSSQQLIIDKDTHQSLGHGCGRQAGKGVGLDCQCRLTALARRFFHNLDGRHWRWVVAPRLGGHHGLCRFKRHGGFNPIVLERRGFGGSTGGIVKPTLMTFFQDMQTRLPQFAALHNGVHHTGFQRGFAIPLSATGNPLRSGIHAHQPGQPDRATPPRDNAQLGFGKSDPGRGRHYPIIAGQTQLQATAQRIAVNRYGHGNREIFEAIEVAVVARQIILHGLLAGGKKSLELADIRTDHQCRLGAADQQPFQLRGRRRGKRIKRFA